ncbi:MAG TPA: tetratricopeptide repeat protein [Armatimonadota bacterium]|nr:tetratricopeptide repeat protein [Armatimonadota bacterium]
MPRRPRSEGDEIRRLTLELREAADPVAFARLAELLCNQGRLVEARSVCEQGIARYPTYTPVRATMAHVCRSEGNLDQAEAELKLVVAAEPQNRVGRVALASLLLERGRSSDAKEHLEYALFLAPGDQDARELLAQASGRDAPEPAPPQALVIAPEVAVKPVRRTESAVDRAMSLVGGTDGVRAVVLVDTSGFPIGTAGEAGESADALAVVIHETWQFASTYVVRMQLGSLQLATVFGTHHSFVLAPCGPGLLAVAATREARLGLVNLQIDEAKDLLATI